MLPEYKKLSEKKRLSSLPTVEPPFTVRLKFRKVGKLQYISHLDLQRTFMRVIVRACIPAWYTKGFNPHAKLVFSTPMSVGTESEYEFLDTTTTTISAVSSPTASPAVATLTFLLAWLRLSWSNFIPNTNIANESWRYSICP